MPLALFAVFGYHYFVLWSFEGQDLTSHLAPMMTAYVLAFVFDVVYYAVLCGRR